MVVTKICEDGFETEEDFFGYDEVRKLYYLTYYGYYHNQYKKGKEKNA